ncbi:increased DNA methylation 1-like [Spinacia oleracea]|uniref:Increased DNA methylation 1-like n=1 Tax=Spinacia oleracea TaxID=3562 RepID=A0ABM3QZU6_SPIOL|nr:increased DNA methylation 1-like [Spinacia oleracea]
MKVVKENTVIKCIHGVRKDHIGYGAITRDGIGCYCCGEVFSVASFPRHRGDIFVDKPYENLFIEETKVSLLSCQIEAWNRHSVPARSGYHHVVRRPRVKDNSDDSCVICADGGDLICCDNCPSTYHLKCLGFKGVPEDEWLCPYCRCKYCDRDTVKDVLLTCFQCLKKYHGQCSNKFDKIPSRPQPLTIPFCGNGCWQVYQKLENMLGRNMPTRDGYSWTLIRKMDLDSVGQNSEDLYLKATCNSTIVLAAKLMEESFKLIVDRQTRTNMIQSVIYNCGMNFSRFYTAILQFQGKIISVASLRLPSPELTEIPFIATTEGQRSKGMCKMLLGALEIALIKIGVESIVIPSSEEMEENWQKKFGFEPLDEAMNRKLTNLNTLMFPKTIRLQKVIKHVKKMMLHHDLNLGLVEEKRYSKLLRLCISLFQETSLMFPGNREAEALIRVSSRVSNMHAAQMMNNE